ncbi:MAG: TetR/AcrR family transcriptional regulator [Cryomorphaceae bacterium]|nr:TetR/AcrR family transcriptional regulator [Flavobacteriales bacterium]
MPHQLQHVRIEVSNKVYLKNPESSELGRKILAHGIEMIDALGMECFTFRKLAAAIGTTESALYRYFENKHKLLLYYVEWYWACLEYELAFGTANLETPEDGLRRAVQIVTRSGEALESDPFDRAQLLRVMVAESSKSFLTKEVDAENRVGLFAQHKSVCRLLSGLISEVAPSYPHPSSLASLFLGAHLDQIYFAAHLPSLSDAGESEASRYKFFETLIFNTIR